MSITFAVIGAQKSASTVIHRYLDAHPQVFVIPGELRAFESPFYERGAVQEIDKVIASEAGSYVAYGFKRPDLLGKPGVAHRLFAYAPSAKMLVILRDPIDRAVSAYFHYMKHGWIPVRPLNVGLDALFKKEYTGHPRSSEILEFGLYSRGLIKYMSLFGESNLLVIDTIELKEHPENVFSRISRYLNIEDSRTNNFDLNANRGMYSTIRLRYHAFVRRIIRRYDPGDQSFSLVRPRLGSFLIKSEDLLAAIVPDRRVELDPSVFGKLCEYYRHDAQLVRQITSQPFTRWKV